MQFICNLLPDTFETIFFHDDYKSRDTLISLFFLLIDISHEAHEAEIVFLNTWIVL